MANKKFCDFCGMEILEREPTRTVTIFNVKTDTEELDKDVCPGCIEVIRRLLLKPIAKLRKALEASCDA